jgi:hypothetical protein
VEVDVDVDVDVNLNLDVDPTLDAGVNDPATMSRSTFKGLMFTGRG